MKTPTRTILKNKYTIFVINISHNILRIKTITEFKIKKLTWKLQIEYLK